MTKNNLVRFIFIAVLASVCLGLDKFIGFSTIPSVITGFVGGILLENRLRAV